METVIKKTTPSILAVEALFQGEIQGMISQIYENEYPPQGLAGVLNWYFNGSLSKFIQQKVITGKKGECNYLPISKHSSIYHLFFIGGGQVHHSTRVKERTAPTSETLHLLYKNLLSLKLKKIGISKSDFGHLSQEAILKTFKGIQVWITG